MTVHAASSDLEPLGNESDLDRQLTPGLYVVSTPIGNLYDITYRACAILKRAEVIACEDTRVARKLLQQLGLMGGQQLVTLNDHASEEQRRRLLLRVANGERVALVSDAGTPLLSDPGYKLLRDAVEMGVRIIPVPGPSALLAALVVAGLPAHAFYFVGFLPPRSAERRRHLAEMNAISSTLVMYESPHRLLETLRDLRDFFADRRVVIARELTKTFEEVIRGTFDDVFNHFHTGGVLRGECVIVLGPEEVTHAHDAHDAQAMHELLQVALQRMSTKHAVQHVTRITGASRKDVYAAALDMAAKEDGA